MSYRTSPYKQYDPGPVFANTVEQFKEQSEPWAWGCCPFHDDRHPSFSMNLETGAYKCMSGHCRASGRSIVGFVSDLMAFDTREALRYLEDHYG